MLAIAGLHLAIKALLYFFITRFILTLIQVVHYGLPIKKIACIMRALQVHHFYLLLAGMPNSTTQRAYISIAYNVPWINFKQGAV